jgi:hypothetical protein
VRRLSRAALLLAASALGSGAAVGAPREVELGAEALGYRTSASPLNRGNLLGLDENEALLRGVLALRESRGPARLVFRGFVERSAGGRDETRWTVRQAYAQWSWGPGLSLRAGKQRVAWGSGFAWNPTNRVEPPKNPLNTGLEQEGSLAARMDWAPAAWAGVALVAARGETSVGDLPFDTGARRRHTAAVRAAFHVADTDLALVFSGGRGQRTLLGADLARAWGEVALHAEGAVYRGAEISPAREGETFFRLAAGLLLTRGMTAVAVEYFFNGEGYDGRERDAYLASLDVAFAAAADPRLAPAARESALASYLARALIPYSGGLGLRRHYLHASWTRSEIRGRFTLAARALVGLEDGGAAVTPGVSFAARDDVTLHLDGVVLLGPGDSEYRLAPLRGALQARVKVLL